MLCCVLFYVDLCDALCCVVLCVVLLKCSVSGALQECSMFVSVCPE